MRARLVLLARKYPDSNAPALLRRLENRLASPPAPAPKPAEKRGPTVGDLRRELKELWKARGIAGADARETIARRFDGATLEEIWSSGDALADLLATYEETE